MIKAGSFWLTRILFLRSLAIIYSVAFVVALFQNKHLLGNRGLLPANLYLSQLRDRLGGRHANVWQLLSAAPTLFWYLDLSHVDFYLDLFAYVGLAVSFAILITGAANMVAMVTLWVIYHSIVNVGQQWYSFGWESQLLETGFLAIWFCPLLSWQVFPKHTPPSKIVLYGYRWLIFRIMLGAGLIKIRGDQCWRDLTCMDYHYETQPNPNPVSYFMHQSPASFHKFEVLANHFAELLAPFLLLIPYRPCLILGGIVQILFMFMIAVSGNLSFLNHLTMLPSLCCLDDKFLSVFFSKRSRDAVLKLQQNDKESRPLGFYIRRAVDVGLLGILAYLSVPVVQNLFSTRQMMNTNFEPLRLVNTYGAFGSITKERTEIVMQGTSDSDPNDPGAVWLEYEFKCKPGNISRPPCLISPYHYRLDWLMWFAAFQNYQHNPWLVHLVAKMLKNDNFTSELLDFNPFLNGHPPRFVRLEHYLYKFTKYHKVKAKKGDWWTRRRIGSYLPPVNYNSLEKILKQFDWI